VKATPNKSIELAADATERPLRLSERVELAPRGCQDGRSGGGPLDARKFPRWPTPRPAQSHGRAGRRDPDCPKAGEIRLYYMVCVFYVNRLSTGSARTAD
jgi:hypothetical protein